MDVIPYHRTASIHTGFFPLAKIARARYGPLHRRGYSAVPVTGTHPRKCLDPPRRRFPWVAGWLAS